MIECLPGSTLPDKLRGLGYIVEQTGQGERILAGSIVERFTRRTTGELEPLVEGSTLPVAETRTHAGITRIKRWRFALT